MTAIFFPIAALLIDILIIIMFFSKKNISNKETRIYSYLLIVNFIECAFNVFGIAYVILHGNLVIFGILQKVDLVMIIIWAYLMFVYVYNISWFKGKRHNIIKKISILIVLVASIFTLCLPCIPIVDGDTINSEGLSPDCAYVAVILFAIGIIICVLFSIFKEKKNIKNKKFFPLYSLILLAIIGLILRSLIPSVVFEPFVMSYVILIMYHTIENPDMKMIEQLNIAKEDAEKANRAKTDFLSSMSHEIRTPLNAIVGFSECLLQADDLSEAKENADDIVVASKTLLEIVNSILDISKIEAGKIEIHNSSYKPNELFSEIERLIRARLGDKELEFRVSIAPDIPEVLYGDHSNIKKVIINLLTNALKYTDQGYFTFEVKCINKNKICRLMIDVKDTGRGIKKENLDKLFTKFQRLDEDRNTTIEGTGLGLAITKQLVELMGGKIIVQSQYGEGSKFSVILDQQISNENINSENVIVVDNLDLSGKKILVVDDNKLNIKVASKILSKYNLNIDSAESGMECLEKIKNGSSYDIIFMDDMMPRMNGGETLLRLKQIEGFKTPVIALTANAINGMKEKYLNQGFNDYLSKPIEKDELHQVLCKYLRDSKEEKNEIEKEEIVYKDYSNKKVLIVDDNKMNIKVASHIMKPYNFEIDEALSGEECLNIIKNKEYDLIFMDYMMPDMDGIETLKNLKKIEGFKTPVIALTADAVVGAREKFLKAGFDEYVSKPIIKESLNKAIDIVLNKN